MTRVVAHAVAVLTLVAASIGLQGAAWARNEIAVSLDGRTWRPEIREPLFDPAFRWVPGDGVTKSFFVRNAGPTKATMTVDVVSVDPSRLLPGLAIHARAGDGPWRPLGDAAGRDRLLTDAVRLGGVVRVDVRVDFDRGSTNRFQRKRLGLDFLVTLSQHRAGPEEPETSDGTGGSGGSGGSAGSSGGLLAGTGSSVQEWLVGLGAALVGSGLGLVVARRRQEHSHG
jgi:LPXTG-motif cell wall-anchored protein